MDNELYSIGKVGEICKITKKALRYYDKVLELDLTDCEAWEWKGSALSYIGEYEKALKCFENVLKIDPDHYKVLRTKASTLSRLGKYKDAIDIFNDLQKRNPKDLSVIEGKATAYFYGKEPEKAIEIFEKALDLLEKIKAKSQTQEKYYEEKEINFQKS